MKDINYRDFTLGSGETVKLSLAHTLQLKLSTKRKDIYAKYSKISGRGSQNELENAYILYAAYACAYVGMNDGDGGMMGETEWYEAMTEDRDAINEALQGLYYPNRKTASAGRS